MFELPDPRDGDAPKRPLKHGVPKLPRCHRCPRYMHLLDGRYGPFWACNDRNCGATRSFNPAKDYNPRPSLGRQ